MARETKAERKARKAKERRQKARIAARRKKARRQFKLDKQAGRTTKKGTARGGQKERTKRRQTRAKERTARVTERQQPENVAARQQALSDIGVSIAESAGGVGEAYFGAMSGASAMEELEWQYGLDGGGAGYEAEGEEEYDPEHDEEEDGFPWPLLALGAAGLYFATA